MSLLISFIKRFKTLLVFILLQTIALNSYTSYLKYPESKVLTAAWSFSSYFLEIKNNLTSYINLKTSNKSLQKENILLRQKTIENYVSLNNKKIKIEDTVLHQRYSFVSANIINSTTNRRNNFFTLNAGSLQNIRSGMGVISSQGIIGIVHSVSGHFSLVKSVLSEEINIAVEIEPNMHFGFLDWSGNSYNEGLITGVSNDAPIKKNSLVTTRGGLIFPKGIPVGSVKGIRNIEGKPEWEISILFSENYKRVQNVYIVNDLLLEEQLKLEQKLTE